MNKLIITVLKIVLINNLICLLKRLYLRAVLNIFILFYFNYTAISQTVPDEPELYQYYANSYPDYGTPRWGNKDWAANGITHDSLNWYFSAVNRKWYGAATDPTDWMLWRVPVKYDINNFSPNEPGVVSFQFSKNLQITDTLRKYGYSHIGDIGHFKYNKVDYIFAPLTGKGPPLIAIFRARDLTYIHYALLDAKVQDNIGWCTISPDGDLYTSKDNTANLLCYKINWDIILGIELKNGRKMENGLSLVDSFQIKDKYGNNMFLRNMQGGAFTTTGELLYVNCGVVYCNVIIHKGGEANEEDGIHVFRTDSWTEVLKSTNSKRDKTISTFDYAFDNRNCNDEPEGLTIWDVDNLKAQHPENIKGHLHVILTNHNKYQILANVLDNKIVKYGAPVAHYTYKGAAKAVSFFKKKKVHTNQVSLKHFGPYPYDGDRDDSGGFLTKQDIVLLEEAYRLLTVGDTLEMIKYFDKNLDENGDPIIPGIPNPPSPVILVYPDKSQKLKPVKGLWTMPSVTIGIRNCSNPFGIGISDIVGKITIRKGRINNDCNLVGSATEIFSKHVSGKLFPNGINILDYIPVLIPEGNKTIADKKFLNPSSPFPFSIYNYYNTWKYEGDSYFTIADNDVNANFKKCENHTRYSYFLGSENDFSCGNFRTFMDRRNKTPSLLSDKKTTYPLFRFSFFIPLTNGVYITDASGNLKNLPQINLAWLKGANNTNTEAFQYFFYNLAVIAAADPSFRFLEEPGLYNKPRAIVTGIVNGRTYLAGVSDKGIYSPVDCGNGKQTSLLIEKLIGSNYETSPLKGICTKYMDDENNRDVIKAFLPSNISIAGKDLKSDLDKIENEINQFQSISSEVKFLIQKSDGQFVMDNAGTQESIDWYSWIGIDNTDLSVLALLYGNSISAYVVDDSKLALLGLNTIYILCNKDPISRKICDLLKNDKNTNRKHGVSLGELEASKQNYDGSKSKLMDRYKQDFENCNCEK